MRLLKKWVRVNRVPVGGTPTGEKWNEAGEIQFKVVEKIKKTSLSRGCTRDENRTRTTVEVTGF